MLREPSKHEKMRQYGVQVRPCPNRARESEVACVAHVLLARRVRVTGWLAVAAQVPRPRLREPAQAAVPGADAAAAGAVAEAGMDEGELLLARLERQHEEQQRQAQAIRQELGLN